MKQLGFLLSFLFSASALAQCVSQSVNGQLVVNENGYYIVNPLTHLSSNVIPSTASSKKALEQLESGDFLSGFGCLSLDRLILNRVEFVGLHRLIGLWESDVAVNVSFQDYNRVSFGRRPGQGNQFRYALVPYQGTQWRVFLSDDMSVMMGTITIDYKDAIMDIFDPDTGNLDQRYSLKKVF